MSERAGVAITALILGTNVGAVIMLLVAGRTPPWGCWFVMASLALTLVGQVLG